MFKQIFDEFFVVCITHMLAKKIKCAYGDFTALHVVIPYGRFRLVPEQFVNIIVKIFFKEIVFL